MKRPDIVTLITGLVLVCTGLFSYLSNENRPPTALIGPAIGAILIACYPGVKNSNKIVAHVVVVLTLLFGLISTQMFFNSYGNAELDELTRSRRVTVFAIMAVACLSATALYVAGFIEKRKERKAAEAGK